VRLTGYRCAELALEVANRHLDEVGTLMGPGHDALEPMPDLLERLAETQCKQDLDPVGP
jgi:hypothetical protein